MIKKEIVIITSGLDDISSELIEKFAQKFDNITLEMNFESTTLKNNKNIITHLVVSSNENKIFPQRTMKYLQAIMNGIWIVEINWIEDSLKENEILKENKYEIKACIKSNFNNAPQRARKVI